MIPGEWFPTSYRFYWFRYFGFKDVNPFLLVDVFFLYSLVHSFIQFLKLRLSDRWSENLIQFSVYNVISAQLNLCFHYGFVLKQFGLYTPELCHPFDQSPIFTKPSNMLRETNHAYLRHLHKTADLSLAECFFLFTCCIELVQ